jgi:Ca2+-binding EF-hand superfamily protein
MKFNIGSFFCMCSKVENKVFEKIDMDKDGKISLNEFHQYFVKKYGKPPSNDQWFKFHLADVNNNGYISKYDCEIFEHNNRLFS